MDSSNNVNMLNDTWALSASGKWTQILPVTPDNAWFGRCVCVRVCRFLCALFSLDASLIAVAAHSLRWARLEAGCT